jgi:protein Mpv17
MVDFRLPSLFSGSDLNINSADIKPLNGADLIRQMASCPGFAAKGLVSLLIVWFGIAAMVPVMQNVNCRRSQTPTVAMASITSKRTVSLPRQKSKLLTWYETQLQERPLIAKGCTSMLCFGLGNVIAQSGSTDFDATAFCFMAMWGALAAAPMGHRWHAFLDERINLAMEGPQRVATKIALDQLVFTPPSTVLFLTFRSLTKGLSLEAAHNSAVEHLVPTLQTNWMVWPFVHIVTFSLVPVNWRVSFLAVCAVFWAMFLSLLQF